jgi:hypothetical protein
MERRGKLMFLNLLPPAFPDEPLVDYVRRAVDYGLGSKLGADLGLVGVYRNLAEAERKMFVVELIARYVDALGAAEILKRVSQRNREEERPSNKDGSSGTKLHQSAAAPYRWSTERSRPDGRRQK